MSEVAAVLAPPAPDRFARGIARMAGRLARAVAAIGGDDGSARFLEDWAARVAPGASIETGDGSCLDLPLGPAQPVDRLVARLAPTPAEVDLLVLAALPHAHEAAASILRSLHPEGRPWPTVGLACTLGELGLLAGVDPLATPRRRVGALLDGGALALAGALAAAAEDVPYAERSLRLGPLLFEALTGADPWPPGCRLDRRPSPPWGLATWLSDPDVVAARAALAARGAVAVVAAGPRPAVLAGRLAALVDASGHRPVMLHAPSLDERCVAAALVLAITRDVVPVFWSDAPPPVPLDLPDLPMPVVVAVPTADVVTWPRPRLVLPTAPLTRADRVDAFEQALPELSPMRHPIGPATVEPGEIAMVAGDLRTRARLGPLPAARTHLVDAVDRHTAVDVPSAAVLIHPSASWDDLVLPSDRRAQLEEAVRRVQHHSIVFDDWGFLPGRSGRGGLRLLFCGPPGTGKTLAAEAMAGALGRDLLMVDLSQMVSKWIGETEKNLAGTFEAAERGGALLFFDEADALFGRRTEVGDARDRYANLETAYLLTRIERFDGVVVLATNLRQNLDPAFARRIEFIVPFDAPDTEGRAELWRRHLPPGAPRSPSVDIDRLAAIYELPGALIRNAALAAAFLAAADDTPISLRHIVHAVRREYVKAGQAFPGAPSGAAP